MIYFFVVNLTFLEGLLVLTRQDSLSSVCTYIWHVSLHSTGATLLFLWQQTFLNGNFVSLTDTSAQQSWQNVVTVYSSHNLPTVGGHKYTRTDAHVHDDDERAHFHKVWKRGQRGHVRAPPVCASQPSFFSSLCRFLTNLHPREVTLF